MNFGVLISTLLVNGLLMAVGLYPIQSAINGRPPSLTWEHVDCEMPFDTLETIGTDPTCEGLPDFELRS